MNLKAYMYTCARVVCHVTFRTEPVFDTGHPGLPWRLLHDSQSKKKKRKEKENVGLNEDAFMGKA